jgi:hypothetical protein
VYERLRGLRACRVLGTKQYRTKVRTNNDEKPRECKVKKNGKSITGTSSVCSCAASPTDRCGHVFVLARDSDKERVQIKDICREQGSTAQRSATLGLAHI